MINARLPPRTVERLSKYRRILDKYKDLEEAYIHSHKLAALLNLTPEQVRRDLMLIGINGNRRKGYCIKVLVDFIGRTIDRQYSHKVALVGIGNLGKAVLNFIRKANTRMNIAAAFDIDVNKVNTDIAGVHCYDLAFAETVIRKEQIKIAILTVPPDTASQTVRLLIQSGIKGILNFTSVPLDVPSGVYTKDYDIITSLEEIGFFIAE